jgi:D-alanyl-D-alanine carboxypeptidase
MWTPVRLNNSKTFEYGFGWGFGRVNGHRIIEHGGAWQGFTSYIARYVDDQTTIIVLDNLAGGNAGRIAHQVAELYNPNLARKPIEDKEPQVTGLVRELLQKLTEGSADQNQFAAALKAEFFPARAERLSRLLKSLGTLNRFQLVERTDKDGDRAYGYELLFQNGQRVFRLTLSNENKITEIALSDF